MDEKKKRLLAFIETICVVLLLSSMVSAQMSQTGSIRGVVTDPEGFPLPGVRITIIGPALIGKINLLTTEKGVFRAPSLPPGSDYVVICELNGFKSVRREGLIVHVGITIELQIVLTPSEIFEEVNVVAPSPMVDIAASKTVQTITSEVMQSLPISRDVIGAIQIAPGVVERRVHGGARNDTAYMIDGVHANAPNQGYAEARISWETIEEIEFITAGAPPEAYHSVGGFMNVVTKSGGNKFSGSIIGYYTSEHLSKALLPDENLMILGISKPSFAIHDIEVAGNLGGPILKDKLWFFANYRYLDHKEHNVFRPTTILGKYYGPYEFGETEHYSYTKLSAQLAKNVRISGMLTLWWRPKPYNAQAWNTPAEACQANNAHQRTGTALLTWIVDNNTFVDIRAGFWRHQSKMPYSVAATEDNPRYYDAFTGYYWGSGRANRIGRKFTWLANAKLTRFQDNFLGGNHEFKTGVEFQYGSQLDNEWRKNSLIEWRFYNENPYYYRGLYGLNNPHPVYGDGYLTFTTVGVESMASARWSYIYRIGGFVQDSWSLGKKLTVNLGLRFDYTTGGMPKLIDNPADSLAQAIGATYFMPKYGFNPYGVLEYEAWDNCMTFTTVSPILGLVFDIFGNRKTALKMSFGQYPEALVTSAYSDVHPAGGRNFTFYWWDLNSNGMPDPPPTDKYQHFGTSPLAMVSTLYRDRLDPDLTAPYVNELMLGIEHELVPDFKVSASYFFKDWKNILADSLYDLATGKFWNTYEKAPDWWVPFKTIVPAYMNFPAQEITMYFMSKKAPEQVTRLTNQPDAVRRYQAVELAFNKRMSRGWQLGGSVVLSKLKGNYDVETTGFYWGRPYQDPSWYINSEGYLTGDRPLHIKLYGSFTFPFGFVGSFFYVHASGDPWTRTVTVVPPTAWASANNAQSLSYSIRVEPLGSRRNEPTDNLDIRFEKRLRIGRWGELAAFIDVYNMMGNTRIVLSKNPAGTWRPADANTTEGTYTPAWLGITGSTGVRTYKLAMRFTF